MTSMPCKIIIASAAVLEGMRDMLDVQGNHHSEPTVPHPPVFSPCPGTSTGSAATNTAAHRQPSGPALHACSVPRCTTISPALTSVHTTLFGSSGSSSLGVSA